MCKTKNKISIWILVFVVIATTVFCIGKNVFAADVNVDKDVLSVKCQTSIKNNGTSDDETDDTADLRMVSSICNLENYKKIGFEVYILNDAGDEVDKKFERTMKDVFSKIETQTEGLEYVFSPQIFRVNSTHFATYTLAGIPDEYFDNGILIKPFIIAKGDSNNTRVYGRSRYTTINDMKTGDSLYLAVENEMLSDNFADWTVKAGETTYTNSNQINVNVTSGTYSVSDAEYTHVKVTGTGTDCKVTSLPSVTTFIISDGTNEVSMQHRDLYSTPNSDGSISPDTTWKTDANGPYVIVTPADLYGLAKESLDNNFSGKIIYLANDITINDSSVMAQIKEGSTVSGVCEWTPIGTSSKQFNGKFFGQGHSISGLYYNDGTNSTTGKNIGFFGVTFTGCQIDNFRIKDSYFRAYQAVGSIAGRTFGGSFSNLYSDATVVCEDQTAGGLLGNVQNASVVETQVNGCWFDGDLTTTANKQQFSGGIVGQVQGASELNVSNCLNTGNIVASRASGGNLTGGIVGAQQGTATLSIQKCLNTGSISNTANKAGLNDIFGGANGSDGSVTIIDSYTTKDFGMMQKDNDVTLSYKINSQDVALSSNGSLDSTSAGNPVISKGNISDDVATTQSTLSGFDFVTAWSAKDGYYPVPTGLADLASLYPTEDYGTPSVLVNGTMDNTSSWTANFDENKYASGTVNWLSDGGVDNSPCLQYDIKSAGNAANGINLFQRMSGLTVTSGEKYILTFWAKISGIESWNIGSLWLRNDDASSKQLSTPLSLRVSGDQWTKYSITFEVKETCEGARLMLQLSDVTFTMPEGRGSVQLYFDNIELKKQ